MIGNRTTWEGAILGGITRNGSVFIPVGTSQIQAEDRVVIFAVPEAIHQVEKYFL